MLLKKTTIKSFYIYFFTLLLFSNALCGQCCNTDIVAYFGKTTTSEKFASKLYEILEDAKKIGAKILNSEIVTNEQLQEFKSKWINFELVYNYSPPVWAINDQNWNRKFEKLMVLIKDFEKYFTERKWLVAHARISTFSRIAISLLEYFPSDLNEDIKKFVKITMSLQKIFEGIENSNLNDIPNSVKEINSILTKFKIDPSNSSLYSKYANLLYILRHLENEYSSTTATKTLEISTHIAVLEKSFEEFVSNYINSSTSQR